MSEKEYTASELIANSIKNSPSAKAMVSSQALYIEEVKDPSIFDICFSEKQKAFINAGTSREDRIRVLLSHRTLLSKLYQLEDNPKKHLLYEKAFDLGFDGLVGLSGIQPFYEMLVDLIQ